MEDQFNNINNPSGAGTAARMKETVSDKAGEAKDKVMQYGRQAVDKLDAQRYPAANALEQTASVLHENSDKAASVSHRAADKIQATAEYIRQHDLKAMGEDVSGLIRRYPAQSMAAAAVLGFVLARSFRRD
jgi:ElaB/YqjD/DUF883 family membrane-anchored ribosome-binding protein